MTINYSSELMKNQQQAVVMAPDPQFEVLQTTSGNSIFFSIGSDGVFYCTCEVPSSTQGWTRTSLSGSLTGTAKFFQVSQNLSAGTIDIALVMAAAGADALYLSLGNADTDTAWGAAPAWTAMPYDNTTYPLTTISVADIYLANGGSTEYIVVDILQNPSNPLQLIRRYFIDPTKTLNPGIAWNTHDLAANMQANTISNCMGKMSGQRVYGIYTMGSIANSAELMYTPVYNFFNANNAPTATLFKPVANATAMAASLNSTGYTDLYIAAGGSLYFIASNAANLATPVSVYTHALLNGVKALLVNNAGTQTIVWGLNLQNQLFYLQVTQGSETTSSAWSYPIPILSNAIGIAAFINNNSNNSVIFAHVQDSGNSNELVQLTRDPVTTAWQSRNIVLPSTATHDMVENHTYTTRVQVLDNNNMSVANTPVNITGTSPCSVYINGNYYVLSTTTALQVTTDVTGVVTIVQAVNGLGAVCYNVQSNGAQASINPMSTVVGRLQSSVNLNVNVTNEHGVSGPLLGPNVSSSDQSAAEDAITQFVNISNSMPQDGSLVSGTTMASVRMAMGVTPATPFGLSFSGTSVSAYGGGDTSSAIDVLGGDIWRWIKDAAEDVANFFVQVVGDVTHFFVQIGEAIYHFVLQCVSDVMHGIEFVLTKIGLGLEDMVRWIGFIFNWSDIVLTHQVLRNVLLQYVNQCAGDIEGVITKTATAFGNIKTDIAGWAGTEPAITQTYAGIKSANPAPAGSDSAPTHWASYQMQNNASNANSTYTPATSTPDPGVEGVLQQLLTFIENEGQTIANLYEGIKSLVESLPTLSIEDFLKQLVALLADALLATAQQGITMVLGIFESLVAGFMDVLTATINIPVLSPMYKKFAHEPLSIFDVLMLISAVPVTVIFKIITNEAPFENNAITMGIIKATSFTAIQQLCAENNPEDDAEDTDTAALSIANTGSKPKQRPKLKSVYDRLAFASNIQAAAGALALSVLTPLKLKFPESIVFPILSAVAYVPYVAPDVMGNIKALTQPKWYVVMNQVCADIGIIKALADAVWSQKAGWGVWWVPASPWVDCALNVIWQVPTCGALWDPKNLNLAGFLNYAGGTFFDLGGCMSPALALDDEPITVGVFTILIIGCNVEYGTATLWSSFV